MVRGWIVGVLGLLIAPGFGTGRVLQPQSFYSEAGTAPLDIQQDALGFLLDGHRDELLRYLEAHPTWRVGIESNAHPDTIVVFYRHPTDHFLNGYFYIDDIQVRRGFVLSDGPIENEFTRETVVLCRHDAGAVAVPLYIYRLMPQFWYGIVYVGEPGFWYRSSEQSPSPALPMMRRMLKDLERELAVVRAVIKRGGTVAEALPADAITMGEPRIEVDAENSQSLLASARVNPGEPGVTTWRVRRVSDGTAYSLLRPELYARERVGFSEDPRQLFFAKSEICIKETETGWETDHEVVFELWFAPDDGGQERKLIELKKAIKGWEN